MNLQDVEIERKFLVIDCSWRKTVKSSHKIIQGYICTDPQHCVRVRIVNHTAYITIKGQGGVGGIERPEFEFEIPVHKAERMLATFCGGRMIEKIRHLIDFAGKTWELDEFTGRHAGLFIAEIELDDPQEKFVAPTWLGKEVTNDHSYANSSLAQT